MGICAWGTENYEAELQCCSPVASRSCWKSSNYSSESLPDPGLKKYSLQLLTAATDKFSEAKLILENRENVPNSVYRCWLATESRWIAVKRFPRGSWPETMDFIWQATRVGELRHESLLSLIGYCCEENERLLVADFGGKLYMPYATLETHLFRRERVPWKRRISVALGVIRALNYCSEKGVPIYHDLNTYRVFLDYKGLPRLSCFGLLKRRGGGMTFNSNNKEYIPPECVQAGNVKFPTSVIYGYGTLLLDLLGGTLHLDPRQAMEFIQTRNYRCLLDPWLEGSKYLDHDAKEFANIARMCLQPNPNFRPSGYAVAQLMAALSWSTSSSLRRTFLSIMSCGCKYKYRST